MPCSRASSRAIAASGSNTLSAATSVTRSSWLRASCTARSSCQSCNAPERRSALTCRDRSRSRLSSPAAPLPGFRRADQRAQLGLHAGQDRARPFLLLHRVGQRVHRLGQPVDLERLHPKRRLVDRRRRGSVVGRQGAVWQARAVAALDRGHRFRPAHARLDRVEPARHGGHGLHRQGLVALDGTQKQRFQRVRDGLHLRQLHRARRPLQRVGAAEHVAQRSTGHRAGAEHRPYRLHVLAILGLERRQQLPSQFELVHAGVRPLRPCRVRS